MKRETLADKFDLAQIIVRPLYFGLTANVIIPMALLLICYYLNENHEPPNTLGLYKDYVFAVFALMAVTQAGYALFWRNKLLHQPMIRSKETFEDDFSDALLVRSRPVFLVIAALCLYGFLFFFLTGEFKETTLFVVFSFIVFQVVRPRYGSVRKLIAFQDTLVARGQFLTGEPT